MYLLLEEMIEFLHHLLASVQKYYMLYIVLYKNYLHHLHYLIHYLQTAYQFTGKEKYKIKALELMDKFGYLENLMRPMSQIGKNDSDENIINKFFLSKYKKKTIED